MSTLEVLQACLTQRKALLSSLRAIKPFYSCLMVFDFDRATLWLPSAVAFQIPISVQDINIHHCIVDDGASTCIMSKSVWKKLGSPKLKPYDIIHRAYNEIPSTPVGLYPSKPVKFAGKIVLIYIKVLDAQLDYNILLGWRCMYVMLATPHWCLE